MNEKFIQLEIWDLLESALAAPMNVDWRPLWKSLDASLLNLDTTEQLQVAADALVQMVEVFQCRSVELFEEINAVTSDDGPVMGGDDFAPFIRQSMDISFDEFIEPLVSSVRKQYEWAPEVENHSIVQIVDKEVLLETLPEIEKSEDNVWESVLDIAHSENVEAWVRAITIYIDNVAPGHVVTMSDLIRELRELAPVEVWLGLLLGSFGMRSDCNFDFDNYDVFSEQFYASDIQVMGAVMIN